MASNPIYHYVYRITNKLEGKHYYGKRSSRISPFDDLGKKYFSSSTDSKFKREQKQFPERFKYKVVFIYDSLESSLRRETELHMKFRVGTNPKFYNIVTQTNNKLRFDSTGCIRVNDEQGNSFFVKLDDPKFLTGEVTAFSKNTAVVIDSNGDIFRVDRSDPKIKSKEFFGVRKGLVSVISENGETMTVSKRDPRYISGELKGVLHNKVVVVDEKGHKFTVSKHDPRYISGELRGHTTGVFNGKDKYGNIFRITKNDPRFISGELKGVRGKFPDK